MPGKRALLIGIDRYPRFPLAPLHGCVNDATTMAAVLRDRFGFPDDRITVLRDEEATQGGIRAGVEALIAATEEDDVVVIHYSGHGSQRSSADPTEGDGLDETIVPHDSGRHPDPNLDIADKEINGWIRRLNERTPNVTLVFDSCHSGTIARDGFGEAGRSVDPDLRPIEEMGMVPPRNDEPASREASVRGPSGWLPLSGRYVLIAGSRDDEVSHEMGAVGGEATVRHGALTYNLVRELADAQPGATYRDVFERASLGVSSRYRDQHPQMEGDARDRELFGTRVLDPSPFVAVAERIDRRVSLAGGAAFGLARGSVWDVHPPGTRHPEPERRLGRLRIEDVRALSSTATILEEAIPGTIAAGARAVEALHALEDQRLAVEVKAPREAAADAADLSAAIEASPFLRLTSAANADLRVYMLEPRDGATADQPVPQVQAVATAAWAVVGRDGRLAVPIHPADEPGAIDVVVDDLEKVARFRRTLVLTNPDPSAVLRGKVDMVLMSRGRGGMWADARPAAAGGRVVYAEGDPIAFRIVNRHTTPVFVAVLDFGLTGRVAQIHPPAGVADRLDPGMEIRVGAGPGPDLPLEFPADFPFARDPGETDPVEGFETLKLVATTGEPLDLDPLLQEPVRGDGGEDAGPSPLGRLLRTALWGRRARDVATQAAEPPDEQWITVDRSFVLRRHGA